MVRTPRIATDGYVRKHKPDYAIVFVMALLMLFGAVVMYTISPALEQSAVLVRQIMHITLAGLAFFIATLIPLDAWKKLHIPLLGAALIASVLLLVGLGREVNGATRWLELGPVSFQPAELIKFALVMYLAAWFSQRIRTQTLNDAHETLTPLLLLTAVTGLFVAVLQKDLGTMIAIAAIFVSMLFVSGIKLRLFWRYIVALGAAAIVSILLFPHRMDRLFTFLRPDGDLDGAGYHINQALIAIGSGGLFGVGLGRSVQVFGYLPEAINDSIFAIIAEQFGFVGSLLVLFLYGALAVRLLRIVEQAPTDYMRLLAAGIFGWLIAHVAINIGAMLGIIPLTGITLPFLSLGGTSLIFIATGLGIMFNISRYTSLAYQREGSDKHEHLARRRRDRRPRSVVGSARI